MEFSTWLTFFAASWAISISPGAGAIAAMSAGLNRAAATLAFTDLVVMAGYTVLGSRVLGALKSPAHIRVVNRTFGGLFVLAGSLLALFKRAA